MQFLFEQIRAALDHGYPATGVVLA
jgi:hypothetical protein